MSGVVAINIKRAQRRGRFARQTEGHLSDVSFEGGSFNRVVAAAAFQQGLFQSLVLSTFLIDALIHSP